MTRDPRPRPAAGAWAATAAVHDGSLLAWSALAVLRALGHGRPGVPDAAVALVNLAAGTPFALRRIRQRRRDPVALLAPFAVGGAVAACVRFRGGWIPVAATVALQALAAADRRVVRAARVAAGVPVAALGGSGVPRMPPQR